MNTRTVVAYGLAATMIGGSLIGANALSTDAGASQSTEVQIVHSGPEPDPIGITNDPPAAAMATAPTSGLQPGDPTTEQPTGPDDGYDHDDHDDEGGEHEHEPEPEDGDGDDHDE